MLTDTRKKTEFSITANAVRDNARPTNQFVIAEGRFALVDWTIRNEGTEIVQVSASGLKLLTADDYEVEQDTFIGYPGPELQFSLTLGPGQVSRGWMAYDVPRGAVLKSVIYHPYGSPQFIIANLP